MPDHPEDVIFSVTMQDVLKICSQRLDVTNLSPEDISLACHEVQAAIDHNLDIREYIDIGLDSWEITRKL